MPWPTTPAPGETYQPDPPDGTVYEYDGDGKWNAQVQPRATSFANYYTEGEVDGLLNNLSGASYPGKLETIAALSGAVDDDPDFHERIDEKAPLDSPVFTGVPEAPTADPATNDDQIATTGFTHGVVNNLIGSVNPNTMETLAELSAAIGDDDDFVGTMTAALAGKAASSHPHAQSDITGLTAALDAKLASSGYTAADVLAKLLTVDGPSSGINADLLDSFHASSFVRTINAVGPDGSGNVAITIGVPLSSTVTPGTGSQTAPTGSTYWNGTATPTTSDRRRIDDATVSHTAVASGRKLRVTYQANFVAPTDTSAASNALGLALFRDSDTDALDWINISPDHVGDGAAIVITPRSVSAEFIVVAPDASAHTYRVAIVSKAGPIDAGTLSRRSLAIQEYAA